MADVVDRETRSRMMAGIGPKNTRPERLLRSALHRRRFRFALHSRALPGTPDIVLPRYRVAIFVHGCFWHRHSGCRFATTPATRPDFWATKFATNVERDARKALRLTEDGWRVAVIWECQLRTADALEKTCERLAAWIPGTRRRFEIRVKVAAKRVREGSGKSALAC